MSTYDKTAATAGSAYSPDNHDGGWDNNDITKRRQEPILPGFRFHPTDEELVGYYLRCKVMKKPLAVEVISQLDIYKFDPWDLPKMAAAAKGEKECYFFCPRDRKYRNSARPNRVTGAGFWKATGTDRPIYSSCGPHNGGERKCIGLKKSLVFYKGRAAKGFKTDWMMHEFRLPSPNTDPPGMPSPEMTVEGGLQPNAWALCRIFKKSTLAHRNAPFPSDLPQLNYYGLQLPGCDTTAMAANSPPEEQSLAYQGLDLDPSHDQSNGQAESGTTSKDVSSGLGDMDHERERNECTSNEGPVQSVHPQLLQPATEVPPTQHKFYVGDSNNTGNFQLEEVNLLQRKVMVGAYTEQDNGHGPQTVPLLVSAGSSADGREIGENRPNTEEENSGFRPPRAPALQEQVQRSQTGYNRPVNQTIDKELIIQHKASSNAAQTHKEDIHEHPGSSPMPTWTVQLPSVPSFGMMNMQELDHNVKISSTTTPGPKPSYNGPPNNSLEVFNSFFGIESPVMSGSLDFMDSIHIFSPRDAAAWPPLSSSMPYTPMEKKDATQIDWDMQNINDPGNLIPATSTSSSSDLEQWSMLASLV